MWLSGKLEARYLGFIIKYLSVYCISGQLFLTLYIYFNVKRSSGFLVLEIYYFIMELQEYYEADDWFHFDMLFDSVEVTAKAYYLNGRISRQELDIIFRKYGLIYS